MSTANVAAMIDHLVQRYGLDDAGSRGECLRWLQLSEEEAWNRGTWWFKWQESSVAMVSGTSLYSLAAGPSGIDEVRLGDGTVLTLLTRDDYRDVVGADATSGTPKLWCLLEPTLLGVNQFGVWPVPNASGTLKVRHERVSGTLADSASSKSQFPVDWRHLVLLRAEVYASAHAGQQGQYQAFLNQYGEQLVALAEKNERRRQNGRA